MKLTYILDHKIPITKENFENIIKNNLELTKDLLDTCINYGYKIELNDIMLCIQYKIDISSIDRFKEFDNICENEEILDLCSKYSFYPNFKNTNDIYELEKECTQKNIKVIIKMFKKGTKPNRRCLENACNVTRNTKIIELLINNGCKVNLQCLKNTNNLKNIQLEYLLEKIEI